MSNKFYDIKIAEILEETSNAKSFVFDVPDEHRSDFSYKSGQYLTLKFDVEGEEERRSYSLSTAPYENKWRVCVKRVEDGKISNLMCDNLKAGDVVSLMPPEGRFTFESDPERQAQYYLFAAGSGITPIIAIAKDILECEPLSTVYLLYGNTNADEIIYSAEIEKMKKSYDGQFFIKHAYSSKEEKKGLLSGLFKKTTVELPYFPGRIGKDTIKKFLQFHPIQNAQKAFAYICGPGSMNEDVKSFLIKKSFLKNNVHYESFGTTDGEHEAPLAAYKGQSEVTVELDGNTLSINLDAGTTILQALLDEGYDPPHSCCSGACSSCMAKITEGKVEMDVHHALDDDDIADGYILTCQSRVATEKIHIKYE